jgi:PAS domain S-box-containing protein
MALRDELYERILRQEQDHALILLDPAGTVVGWTMGAENVFGYASEELVGGDMERLFTPEDIARGEPEQEREVAKSTGKAEDDRWQIRKDGTRFWANGILTCIRDERGQLLGYAKMLRDRTDVKAQLETFQQRVSALERAQERRNLFLGALAHELRNPLGTLMNATQLMTARRSPSAEDLAISIRVIERQIKFIHNITEDMFEMARLEHGKVTLELKEVNLEQVVAEASASCEAALQHAQQQVEVLFPAGGIRVPGDATRLQQVFVNLITNASKFSQRGGRIWVKATVEGDEAVVRVEDLGRGIPKALLPRIFDLFTQAGPTNHSVSPGIGLGLALVKNIVELHGGSVQARSEGENRGSEFAVRLPTQRPAAPAPQPAN